MTLIYIIFILVLICEQYILRLLHNKHYFSYKNSEENFLELRLTIILCKGFDKEYNIFKRSIKVIDFIKIYFLQTKIKKKDFKSNLNYENKVVLYMKNMFECFYKK